MKPLACVTCGPAHEPIDSVRRITNFATGEIGTLLSRALQDIGFSVVCFRGEGSTSPAPQDVEVRTFSTNLSLATGIETLIGPPQVIFHAAALCDFGVVPLDTDEKKISSRAGGLTISLHPLPKVLPQIRTWFPQALIVGWKYELDGGREQAITRAASQIEESQTDACVVNGAAFGPDFGFLKADGSMDLLPDKHVLATHLAQWALENIKPQEA